MVAGRRAAASGLAGADRAARLGGQVVRAGARWLGAGLLALARGGRWVLGRAAGMAITLALLGCAGAGVLAWRLGQGPLDVTGPARWAAERAGAPVSFGAVTVAWSDAPGGRGLLVRAQGVRTEDADVAEAEADLPVAALLAGEVQPRRVDVSGVRLRKGGGGEGPGLQQVLDMLRQPGGGPSVLQQLRTVRVRDAAATVPDERLGPVQVSGDIDLQRGDAGGLTGTAALRVAAGGTEAVLDVRAAADTGGTRVSATLSPIAAAAMLRLLPKPPPVVPEGAVTLSLDMELTDALLPRTLSVRAGMGGGRLLLPGATIMVDSLALEGTAAWNGPGPLPDQVEIGRAQAVVGSPGGGWPTTIQASGRATRAEGRVALEGSASVDRLAFADLGAVWPAAWGGQARPWIVRNLSAGMARDAQAEAALDLREDGTDVQVRRFAASLTGDDVSINWLRPVPPLEHVQAQLTMRDLDVIEIAIASGRQGAVALSNGSVRITGLAKKDQDLAISGDVAGAVPELLALLRHPRLKLADKLPKVTNPAGSLAGKLTVTLPLEKDLQFEQVGIGVTGRLQGLRLGNLVARRDFDRGDVQAEVTQDGLRATGTGTLGAVPGQFTAELDFRSGKPDQVVERIKANGQVTPRQLAAAGLDAGEVFNNGSAAYDVEYIGRRSKEASVAVRADLRGAALEVAGWKKAPGPAATASATVVLRDGDIRGVDELAAQGPGLELRGRADMVGDVPALLVLERIVLGPTRGAGTVELPTTKGGPVRVALQGAVLDIAAELSGKGSKGNGPGTAFVADVRFDKVLVGEGRSVSGVQAHAEYDGRTMRVLRVQSSGPERIQAVIAPEGRTRRVSVRAADGGLVLRAMDITDSILGGALALEARYDDSLAGAPLAGTLDISDFHVAEAAVLGKVLQAVTVYGIADALSGPGVAFSRLIMPFRYVGEVLELGETQAFSASLGLTARGRVDVGRRRADVTGTVVPAYVLNSALGRLPLVGSLFSAERGGGLLAVEYAVRGPLGDASVSVNPLSALTPGALRRLFRVFD